MADRAVAEGSAVPLRPGNGCRGGQRPGSVAVGVRERGFLRGPWGIAPGGFLLLPDSAPGPLQRDRARGEALSPRRLARRGQEPVRRGVTSVRRGGAAGGLPPRPPAALSPPAPPRRGRPARRRPSGSSGPGIRPRPCPPLRLTCRGCAVAPRTILSHRRGAVHWRVGGGSGLPTVALR